METHMLKQRALYGETKTPQEPLTRRSVVSWIVWLRINQIVSEHRSQLFQQERREKKKEREGRRKRGRERTGEKKRGRRKQ